MSAIHRGEVYDVIPDPTIGAEIQKKRPGVIVSTNVFNSSSSLAVVCPVTEGANLRPDLIHILVTKGEGGMTKDSIILCDQVKAVDKLRLVEKRGNLNSATMRKVDDGLKAVLGF